MSGKLRSALRFTIPIRQPLPSWPCTLCGSNIRTRTFNSFRLHLEKEKYVMPETTLIAGTDTSGKRRNR